MCYRGYNLIMCGIEKNSIKIDEKLATLRFICDNKTHIVVDAQKCKICKDKNCVYFCPAGVYDFENNTDVPNIDYENCLECGTCRLSCPYDAIKWSCPKGGHGVRYRFG